MKNALKHVATLCLARLAYIIRMDWLICQATISQNISNKNSYKSSDPMPNVIERDLMLQKEI